MITTACEYFSTALAIIGLGTLVGLGTEQEITDAKIKALTLSIWVFLFCSALFHYQIRGGRIFSPVQLSNEAQNKVLNDFFGNIGWTVYQSIKLSVIHTGYQAARRLTPIIWQESK